MRFITDNRKVDQTESKEMVVLAAGFARCATSSLQHAFENELGITPCMHMAHVAPHVDRLKLAHDAQLEMNKEKRRKMLHKLFDGYGASTDYPGMLFADDLMDMYPNAKIILNKRKTPEAWFRSLSNTIVYFSSRSYLYTCWWWPTDFWHWKTHQAAVLLVRRRYKTEPVYSIATYEAHNQWVLDEAKKRGKEVLVWEPSDGWEPICKFLGKPVPDKPFPHLNDESTIRLLTRILIVRGLAAWAAVIAVPAASIYYGYKWLF